MADELRVLIAKAADQLKAAGAREVLLFGSAARGAVHDRSDIDMAVSGLPPEKFFKAMAAASSVLGHAIDLIDLDEDTPFIRNLKSEGELQRVG